MRPAGVIGRRGRAGRTRVPEVQVFLELFDDRRVVDAGHPAHPSPAMGTGQWIDCIRLQGCKVERSRSQSRDLLDQARPGGAGRVSEVRIQRRFVYDNFPVIFCAVPAHVAAANVVPAVVPNQVFALVRGRLEQQRRALGPGHDLVVAFQSLVYPGAVDDHADVRVKSHQVAEGLNEGDEARRAIRQYFAVLLL